MLRNWDAVVQQLGESGMQPAVKLLNFEQIGKSYEKM